MSDKERAARLERLGEQIHVSRVRRGLSLREVARRAGIDAGFLSHIEHGNREASDTTLEALSMALETAIEREVPAWVEQLASEWEERAIAGAAAPPTADGLVPSSNAQLVHCAAELRERAKEQR